MSSLNKSVVFKFIIHHCEFSDQNVNGFGNRGLFTNLFTENNFNLIKKNCFHT